jgi:hypothetical protein
VTDEKPLVVEGAQVLLAMFIAKSVVLSALAMHQKVLILAAAS